MAAVKIFKKFQTLLDVIWASIPDGSVLQRSGSSIVGASLASTSLSDSTALVRNNQANSYSAGNKQTFQAGAGSAGFRWAGVSSDPSTLVEGDFWYRSDLHTLRYQVNGSVETVASKTYADAEATTRSNADLSLQSQVNGKAASGANADITALSSLTGAIATPTQITLATGSISVSTPILGGTQTWNAGGVTFTAIKLNITDTASASASLLMDLQVGGSTKIKTDKSGITTTNQLIGVGGVSGYAGQTAGVVAQNGIYLASGNLYTGSTEVVLNSGVGLSVRASLGYGFASGSSGGTNDTQLARNAAGVVEINNGTAGTFRDLKLRNIFASLPTSDPHVSGQFWNNSGVVTVSAG